MLKSKNKLLHKALAFVLTFSLLASLISFNFMASAEITGKGTANDPYTISTLDDLKAFANSVNTGDSKYTNAYVKLADNSNITITDSWTPIGNADNKFTGVFDGNSGTINFDNINVDNGYVGLFGINEGTIKNVTVEGNISSSTAKAFVGGVTGLNRGTITNCTNSATISATGANSYAGGIAGVMQYGTIDTCTNSDTINVNVSSATSSSDITDREASAGGIVAFNYNGTVKKSTNTGNIENNDSHGYTGGIVGNNDGVIDNCLNSENATITNTNTNASSYVGGIAGNLFTNNDTGSIATISNCLNTTDSGKVVGTNGTGNNEGTVTNSYYKAESENDGIDGTTAVNENQLLNGEVTYKLNGETSANPVWGQAIDIENSLPVIGANDSSTVYPNEDQDKPYTNKAPSQCEHNYVNGACTNCGDILAKVSGHNINLTKAIGFNFYFDVKNTINISDLSVSFNNEPGTIAEEKKLTSGLADGYKRYVSTVNLNSDQMNYEVTATLSFNYNNTDHITVTSSPYTVNKYLNTLYTAPTGDIAKTKKLVQAMETYGFYANEYFGNYKTYETAVTMLDLSTIDTNKLNGAEYNYTLAGTNGTFTHYASSLQYLEEISGVFYVKGYNDNDTVYMQYTKLGINDTSTGSSSAVTKQVMKTSNGYSYAITEPVSIVELGTTKFAVTFGTKENENYEVKSNIKYYSPYTYIRNIIRQYSDDQENSAYKLAVALFSYSEAAKVYFDAVAATE